jgi:hypothetical protein
VLEYVLCNVGLYSVSSGYLNYALTHVRDWGSGAHNVHARITLPRKEEWSGRQAREDLDEIRKKTDLRIFSQMWFLWKIVPTYEVLPGLILIRNCMTCARARQENRQRQERMRTVACGVRCREASTYTAKSQSFALHSLEDWQEGGTHQ